MKLRQEVKAFAIAMENTLRRNDHKGKTGWKSASTFTLLNLLWKEMLEVERAVQRYDHGKVTVDLPKHELTDVANFCMMLWDVLSQGVDTPAKNRRAK